jgi:hypothetical protein
MWLVHVSHGLHLLVKDIFAAKKKDVPGGGPADYPAGYPFEDLLQFAIDCKDVVSFFHNHHDPKAKLKKALAAAKLSGLVQPAPTHWGTLNGCFKLLRAADNILNGLVSERDFVTKRILLPYERRLKILSTNFPKKMVPQVKHGWSSWLKNILLFGLKHSEKGNRAHSSWERSASRRRFSNGDGTDWPLLQNLALHVSMAASSAASERNFSTFGFIHSKLMKQLVYIKTNSLQMCCSRTMIATVTRILL